MLTPEVSDDLAHSRCIGAKLEAARERTKRPERPPFGKGREPQAGEPPFWLKHFPVRWLHPLRRAQGRAPQDEVLDPHGEERGNAARLEPRGNGCVVMIRPKRPSFPRLSVASQFDYGGQRANNLAIIESP
jgi:hypothetical protein